jgi:hypothetical protein
MNPIGFLIGEVKGMAWYRALRVSKLQQESGLAPQIVTLASLLNRLVVNLFPAVKYDFDD